MLPGHIFNFYNQRFHVYILRKEEIPVQHLAITQQMRSVIAGDFLTLRTITLNKNEACRECSPANL